MSWLDSIGDFFGEMYHKVEKVVTTVYNDGKQVVNDILGIVDKTTGGAVKAVDHIVTDAIDKTEKLGSNLGKDVADISSNLQMPLVVGGLGVLGYLILKK
jgi:hypothetical protein